MSTKRPPASIRNNNPGACEPGYATKRFGSTAFETLRWQDDSGKARTNRIATMPTPVHGAAAQMHLLTTGKYYRNKPLREAIETWCGGFSSATYQKVLKDKAGVTPDTVLTRELMQDRTFAVPLCKAMARQEAGFEFPMSDDDWQAAHAMAFGNGLAPAPTPDNDVPYQKPEGRVRDAVTAVAKTAAKAGGALGAAGAGATQIPGVPEAVSVGVSNITAWKDIGGTVVSLGQSAVAMWWLALPLAVIMGGLWLFNRGEHAES